MGGAPPGVVAFFLIVVAAFAPSFGGTLPKATVTRVADGDPIKACPAAENAGQTRGESDLIGGRYEPPSTPYRAQATSARHTRCKGF